MVFASKSYRIGGGMTEKPRNGLSAVPPPGKSMKNKESHAQSQVISARLHPAFAEERTALDIFNANVKAGYSPRAILTDALNRMAGLTPEMFHEQEHINSLAYRLERQLDEIGGLSDQIESGIGGLNTQIEAMRAELLAALADRIGDILRSIKNADPIAFKEFAETEDEGIELSADFIANAKKAFKGNYR